MDDLNAHRGERVRELIERRDCELAYLPSYSPDLNPIEEAFSKLKGSMRKAQEPVAERHCWRLWARRFRPSEPRMRWASSSTAATVQRFNHFDHRYRSRRRRASRARYEGRVWLEHLQRRARGRRKTRRRTPGWARALLRPSYMGADGRDARRHSEPLCSPLAARQATTSRVGSSKRVGGVDSPPRNRGQTAALNCRGVRRGCSVADRPLFRTLYRLRWGPGRIGKSRAALLNVVVGCPGVSRSELVHRLGRKPTPLKKCRPTPRTPTRSKEPFEGQVAFAGSQGPNS
jgi:hypothetical protein